MTRVSLDNFRDPHSEVWLLSSRLSFPFEEGAPAPLNRSCSPLRPARNVETLNERTNERMNEWAAPAAGPLLRRPLAQAWPRNPTVARPARPRAPELRAASRLLPQIPAPPGLVTSANPRPGLGRGTRGEGARS